jgi:hypothetical protein
LPCIDHDGGARKFGLAILFVILLPLQHSAPVLAFRPTGLVPDGPIKNDKSWENEMLKKTFVCSVAVAAVLAASAAFADTKGNQESRG